METPGLQRLDGTRDKGRAGFRPRDGIRADEFGIIDYAVRWLTRWSVRVIPRSIRTQAHKNAEQRLRE